MTHESSCWPLNAKCLISAMFPLTLILSGCFWIIAGHFGQSYLTKWPCCKCIKDNNNLQHLSLFSSKRRKMWHLLWPLPMSNNIKTSLDNLLDSETLSSQNKWFCPSCDTLTESTKETSITNSSSVLIVQLTRFSILDNRAIKDEQIFDCFPNSVLKVPITLDDEVSFTNKYSLVATINHSGSLDRGHYWAFIKDALSKQWFSCNDKVVLGVNEKSFCNSSSYVIFYLKS